MVSILFFVAAKNTKSIKACYHIVDLDLSHPYKFVNVKRNLVLAVTTTKEQKQKYTTKMDLLAIV